MTRLPPSIIRRIREEGGLVTFARFMELALTDPESGYYARADRFLGESGDFTTAPRKAPAFNRALARVIADLIDPIPDPRVVVVEVGAGEGDLAAGILGHWMDTRPDLRARVAYRVDDVGERLRERQLAALAPAAEAGWDVGVWRADADAAVTPVGLVISNELLDAFPVHLVDVGGDAPREAWVSIRDTSGGVPALAEEWRELSAEAAAELDRILPALSGDALRRVTADGFLELRPAVHDFLASWSNAFGEVAVLTIDYGEWLAGPGEDALSEAPAGIVGDPASAVKTDLHRRSLRAYLRHQLSRDVYANAGRQDLTADVDFRALATHGAELGFEVILYCRLASFLRAAGAARDLPDLGRNVPYSLEADMRAAPLASLLAEDGVGAMFKVMLQVRDKGGN